MKKFCFIGFLLFWGIFIVRAENDPVTISSSNTEAVFEERPIASPPFGVGEKIEYQIDYAFVPAGFACLQILSTETVSGRTAWRIFSEAKTNKTTDVFFKVRDKNESWMDTERWCSLRYREDIREGGYKRRSETVFDHGSLTFRYTKWRKGTESHKEGTLSPFVQDVLSALYFIRTLPLTMGQEIPLNANSGSSNWPLIIRVLGREKIKVPGGTFRCIRVEPVMAGDGLFKAKGKLEVWLTDDFQRIPVKLRSKVAVGAFDADMIAYQPPHLLE